jgi:hypothetical protein
MAGIGSLANATNSYTSSITASATQSESESKASSKTAANSGTSPATILTLSSQAVTGVAPAKTFAQVTTDARSTLDANLGKMKAAGHAFDYNTATEADVNSVLSGLDRRSLYAIASNSGGAFSQDEQNVAQSQMTRQQVSAMGLDNPAIFIADPSAGFKAGVKFLDGVSAEEKSSANWKLNRASSQAGYESNFATDHPGQTADNLASGDPVVNMLVKAIHASEGTLSSTNDGSYVKDISKISLFKDGRFAAQLQQALQESKRVDVTA